MKRHTTLRRAASLALGAIALGALGTAARAQNFKVTLNTSSLTGTTGTLDFLFNPGGPDAQNATLQVSGFSSDGTLAGTATASGGGAGTLPGTLTIANSGSNNEVFQDITFGSTLSFSALFSGPALTPPSGTTSGSQFAFTLFNSANHPILANNPGGSALEITVNADGSLTAQPAPPGANGLTVTAAPVPESSGALSLGLLLALGAGGLAATRRKRARA